MDELDKHYYKISEVSELLDIPASTLRFWEKCFPQLAPRRNEGGRRFYTPSDIEKLRQIHYLVKEKGLKLEAACEQLKKNKSGIEHKVEAITRLRKVRERLQTLLDAVNVKK